MSALPNPGACAAGQAVSCSAGLLASASESANEAGTRPAHHARCNPRAYGAEEREALRQGKHEAEGRLTEIRTELAALLGDAAHATAGDFEFFWVSIPHRAYSVPEGVTRFVWARRRRDKRRAARAKVRQSILARCDDVRHP